jgi:ABC-2 type transport system permease protein
MILLFGSIYGNTPSSEFMGRGMVDVSVPAYFALIISVTAFMSIPMTLSEYREKKILKKYMTTPLRKTDILIALLIINLITTLLGIVLLYITAKIQYSIKFEGNFIIFALCLLLSICSMYSFGLLLSNLGKTIKTTNTICYCMFFPMLFLSEPLFPKEIFPVSVLMFQRCFHSVMLLMC